MATVRMTEEAVQDVGELPSDMKLRLRAVMERLAKWPEVSGAKPLRGELAGQFRIRMGDWRVVFQPVGDDVVITRVANRKDVYDD